jgi:tetratricopeptide (TPR) repeat protein
MPLTSTGETGNYDFKTDNVYFFMNDGNKRIRCGVTLQALETLDPKLTSRCAAHIKKGEADLALSDCNQAIQLDPKNAMAYHNRAAGYSAKGDYYRAIGDLDQVIQLDPKNAMAYANRCAAHFNKGETDLALSDCNQVIQLDPKDGGSRMP